MVMRNRPPFLNAWLATAILILACGAAGIVSDPEYSTHVPTWGIWSCSFLLAIGARSYQYFIQRR